MNLLLIVMLIVVAGFIIWGYWRGFVRIAFSLVSMILVIVLVSWTAPYLTDYLKENTNIYENLTEKCSRQIQHVAESAIQNTGEETVAGDETQVDGILLPKIWVQELLAKAGDAVEDTMESTGLYHQAGAYLADWALKGIAFFAAFFLVSIVLRLVVGLLDIVTKLPLIKGVNRFLGGAAGLVQGILVVWLFLFLVAVACTSAFGQLMLGYVKESAILSYLYENNGVLYLFHIIFG